MYYKHYQNGKKEFPENFEAYLFAIKMDNWISSSVMNNLRKFKTSNAIDVFFPKEKMPSIEERN